MKEKLDILLGEALERLDEAASVIRAMPDLDEKASLSDLGRAIWYAWELRQRLYKQWPDLKADFVTESEHDPQRYERLSHQVRDAVAEEEAGHLDTAEAAYRTLLTTSSYGYFKMQAEAGLFRIQQMKNAEPSGGGSGIPPPRR